MSKRSGLAVVVAAAFLAACGGGGGGGGAPDGGGGVFPTPAYDMNAAVATVLSQGASFQNLRASAGGLDLTMSITYAPASDGAFQGVVYKRSVETLTISDSTQPRPDTFTGTYFYTLAPTRLVGGVDQTGFTMMFDPTGEFPRAGFIGESGPYAHVRGYEATGQAVPDNFMGWSLDDAGAGLAWACMVWQLASGEMYEKDCFRIDQIGRISGAQATLYFDGQVLVFR